jgi:NTP pyrophosphatase (non-canonical NTP hydrolase)
VDHTAVLAAFDEIARKNQWQSLHTPKNLAMALGVEVAELSRHLQWRSDSDIQELMQSAEQGDVAAELADIQMYLIKLAAVMQVDLEAAVQTKIAANSQRHLHRQHQ